jgi:tRNA-splicing ligase RtcB
MITMHVKFNSANIFIDEIEETTREQIQGFLNHPAFARSYIAIMPDCHAGAGAVIGLTMKMNGYVIPNVVGVDIGCGILGANIGAKAIDLPALDAFIKAEIPAGFRIHTKPTTVADEEWPTLLVETCEAIEYDPDRARRSLGTLGGGNHFIEVDEDESGEKWILVHSGSRNFGLSIANHYQRKAKDAMNQYFIGDEYKGLEFIPPGTGLDKEYLSAMTTAQNFARTNRRTIVEKVLGYLGVESGKIIESVHNYIAEDNIIRKGAISAYEGEPCIIPFNMRDGVAICRGKGSAKHNFSAPHGAGRTMSRKKAKETLSLESFQGGMAAAGVYTTTATKETLDEAPDAYKPMEFILRNIEETVEVVTMLKPIYNFKAAE